MALEDEKNQLVNEFQTLFQNNGQSPYGTGLGGKLRPTDLWPWLTKLVNKVFELGKVRSVNDQLPDANGNIVLDTSAGSPSFSNLAGSPTDNQALMTYLSNQVESRTYAELENLRSTGKLIIGKFYQVNDFQTIHIIPNSNALNVHGTVYEDKTAWTKANSEGVEPLTILAIAPDKFSLRAYSAAFPIDEIDYNFQNNLCEDNITPRKGLIMRVKDTVRNVETPYDFRKHLFRRWRINPPTWATSTSYTGNSTVLHLGKLYVCRVANAGQDPSASINYWYPIYNITANSTFANRSLDFYVATHPTTFKIARWNVPVDATSWFDYKTFNKITGANTREVGDAYALGFVSDVLIRPAPTSPKLFNNIVFLTLPNNAGGVVRNVQFDSDCTNMTIGWQCSASRFGASCSNNLFKIGPGESYFSPKTQNNVFSDGVSLINAFALFHSNAVLDVFRYNNLFNVFYENLLLKKFDNQYCNADFVRNECREIWDFNHSMNAIADSIFQQAINNNIFMVRLANKTITQAYTQKQISYASVPTGKLFYTEIDDAGHLITQPFI